MNRHLFAVHAAASTIVLFAVFAALCLLPGVCLAQATAPATAEVPATTDTSSPATAADAASPPQTAPTALEPPMEELRKMIGKPAEVTFTIMTVGGRSNLYLNSMKEWRSTNCFTAKLSTGAKEELKKLGTDEPFDDLIGRRVRCRGDLVLDRDRVQIVVSDLAEQLEFVDDKGKAAGATAAASTASSAASTNPSEPYISPSIEEIRAAVGKELAVTFRAMNAGGRSHLYVNSQQNYRRADCFTAQIEPSAVAGLKELGIENPRGALVGKLIECRGTVKLTENRPNIVVTDVKSQLKIVDVPAAETAKTSAETKPAGEATPAEPPATQ